MIKMLTKKIHYKIHLWNGHILLKMHYRRWWLLFVCSSYFVLFDTFVEWWITHTKGITSKRWASAGKAGCLFCACITCKKNEHTLFQAHHQWGVFYSMNSVVKLFCQKDCFFQHYSSQLQEAFCERLQPMGVNRKRWN